MSPQIAELLADPVAVRWRQPFVTALGRRPMTTRNLVVRVRLSNGLVGYGEGSSSLAMPTQTVEAMREAVDRLRPRLIGRSLASYQTLIAALWGHAGSHPTALAAVEMALFDACARTRGLPLYRLLGGRTTSVESDLTLAAWPAPRASRVARLAWRRGFRRFKIKVGTEDLDADLRRVLAVALAAPRAELLLDANQGWTVGQTLRALRALERRRIIPRLIEQPVPRAATTALRELARRSPIPVFVDESARSPDDLRHIVRHRLAQGVNIKLAKSGILGALQMVRLARRAGLRLMIGCMAESTIGLSASVHLACGLGVFEEVDLDTHWLLYPLRCRSALTAAGPRLSVSRRSPGTGIVWTGPA
ncbi:MAG: dipeptide epimerase [Candidatus Omnitrophica bacterium]|nr:dipeptide epimerase [Candidatus Omnitrophota bacterium]